MRPCLHKYEILHWWRWVLYNRKQSHLGMMRWVMLNPVEFIADNNCGPANWNYCLSMGVRRGRQGGDFSPSGFWNILLIYVGLLIILVIKGSETMKMTIKTYNILKYYTFSSSIFVFSAFIGPRVMNFKFPLKIFPPSEKIPADGHVLEVYSNLQPSGYEAQNTPLQHRVPSQYCLLNGLNKERNFTLKCIAKCLYSQQR